MAFSQYTAKSADDVVKELGVQKEGLTSADAAARLAKYGPNLLKAKNIHWYNIFFRQFKSSFVYLLLLATVLAFSLGDRFEGSMILLFVLVNTFLGFFQEFKSQNALKLLKKLVVAKATVLRNGKVADINTEELVPGDIVLLETGDSIPADLRFIQVDNLTVDESILTGESEPANKISEPLKKEATKAVEAENIGFSGTMVVGGEGRGVVIATGENSILGEITKLTVETVHESTFEKGISRFSNFILRLVLITIVFVFIVNFFLKQGKVSWVDLVVFSIALAVTVIPEALPVVITFALSRGALKLAKAKVVVKRLSAIEDLGSIDVLCSDKTGTLTENKLTVDSLFPEKADKAIFYSVLASAYLTQKGIEHANPFDTALFDKLSAAEKAEMKKYAVVSQTPFDPVTRRNSVVVSGDKEHQLIVRGAPESVLASSHLKPEFKKEALEWFAKQGEEGRRVIAVARMPLAGQAKATGKEKDLEFIGMVAFLDPIKKTAENTVKKAEQLGVKIKILTGDSAQVAGAVGYKIGLLDSPKDVMLGDDFDKLAVSEQHAATEKYHVFARMSPQQKYKVIELLQEKHEVGFLGEGINDAPALKIANIGIVVDNASDVARDAADIVLLKRSLSVVVDGIEEGRRVFANITKYIRSTLTSNFGNFYTLAIASLLLDFLPILPLQILLLNLLTDLPMIAISMDNVDPQELRNPRNYDIRNIALVGTILGLVSTVFDFIFFAIFSRISPQALQTNWFILSILGELVLFFSIRTRLPFYKSKRPAWPLIGLTLLVSAFAFIIPYTQIGHHYFNFISPNKMQLALVLGVLFVYFFTTEAVKLLYYSRSSSSPVQPPIKRLRHSGQAPAKI